MGCSAHLKKMKNRFMSLILTVSMRNFLILKSNLNNVNKLLQISKLLVINFLNDGKSRFRGQRFPTAYLTRI